MIDTGRDRYSLRVLRTAIGHNRCPCIGVESTNDFYNVSSGSRGRQLMSASHDAANRVSPTSPTSPTSPMDSGGRCWTGPSSPPPCSPFYLHRSGLNHRNPNSGKSRPTHEAGQVVVQLCFTRSVSAVRCCLKVLSTIIDAL